MSIRLRLTLLYSAILALTLIAFSGILYTLQSQYTLNIIKNDLVTNANRVIPLVFLTGRTRDHGRFPPLPDLALEAGELRTRDTVRLLDAQGEPFDVPVNEVGEDLALSQEGLEQLQGGHSWIEVSRGEEGRALTYSVPVEYEGEIVAVVQIGRSLADRDRSLQALGMTLILGSLLTTLIAFGVGWVLSGATLQPIHRLTQAALEIGQSRDFSSRVAHAGPEDELGRLARTFNGMLSRLQDAYQQVAHSLEVQRGFVADVSHELRTPLTTIRGNLALLQRKPPLPRTEREDVLSDLTGESERLIRLVSDLLTLARVDAGRRLDCEAVDVEPLVQDVCRQAQLLEPEREIECKAAHEATVTADRDALRQVLLILLDNAIKHARGTIQVALGEQDHEVTISVRDGGPGIPHELRDRIFDRFYQGDTSRSTPGFGLGLSIAKALVEAQGGTIAVDSVVGQGSTFTVHMPKADPAVSPA
jgi:two-component system OmpR family sensor kinase